MVDETQAKLSALFAEDGLKTPIHLTIFSRGDVFLNLFVRKGFEEIRKNGEIVLEILFVVSGSIDAKFYWIADGEKAQLNSSKGFPVDAIEFGNFLNR